MTETTADRFKGSFTPSVSTMMWSSIPAKHTIDEHFNKLKPAVTNNQTKANRGPW
jgi:hypothetical protein